MSAQLLLQIEWIEWYIRMATMMLIFISTHHLEGGE